MDGRAAGARGGQPNAVFAIGQSSQEKGGPVCAFMAYRAS